MHDWEELLPGLRAGRAQDWQKLVDALQGELYSIAYNRLRCPELAKDVLQKTFLDIHRAIPNIKRLSTAYFKIAVVRECIKVGTRDRNRRNVSLDTADWETEEEATSWANRIAFGDKDEQTPQAILIKNEYLKAIKPIVDSLDDPDDREILRLKFWQEETFAEIASHLGKPIPTVHYRMRRALEQVRQKLEEGHFR